jgi:hypothetical protein
MEVEEHLGRAAGFEASIAKLDPVGDTELFVVFLMRAGTHRVNAALHALGITAVQAGGGRIGDLNHTYKPPLEVRLPEAVLEMFAPLKFLEDLRPEYVRGEKLLTPEIAAKCREAYRDIVARSGAILGRGRENAA